MAEERFNVGATPKTRRTGGVNSRLEDSFHNAMDCRAEIKYEKSWHRLAVFMSAQGQSNTQIAERLGRSEAQVSMVLRQTWAQERIQSEIRLNGRDILQDILTEVGPNTLLEVVDLGRTADSEAVRLGCKKEILDRLLGKPNQPMTVEQKPAEKKTDDELRASVSRVLNGLGGPSGIPSATEG